MSILPWLLVALVARLPVSVLPTTATWRDGSATSMESGFETFNVTSIMPQVQEFWETKASKILYGGVCTGIMIIGTLCNMLSLLVFSRKAMKQSVTSMYFRILALCDTSVLITGGTVFFGLGAFNYDVRHTQAACKFFIPTMLTMCYFSCWVLVFISVDRFIGVYFPHKYRTLCTKRKAGISMVFLLIVNWATTGVYMVTITDIQEDGSCQIGEQYGRFFGRVFIYLDLAILNVIPTAILLFMNIAIIAKIVDANRHRQTTMAADNQKEKGGSAIFNSATVILLSVSFVYFLCTIPSSTKFLMKSLFAENAHGAAQSTLYDTFCDTLYLFNHGCNFFLYCFHGSTFKKELFALFGKKLHIAGSTASSYAMSKTQTSTVE